MVEDILLHVNIFFFADPCIDMGISPTDFVAACSEDEVLVALNTLYGDEEGEEKREDMTKETEGGLFLSVKTKKETKASTKDTEVAITPESGVGPRAYPGNQEPSLTCLQF